MKLGEIVGSNEYVQPENNDDDYSLPSSPSSEKSEGDCNAGFSGVVIFAALIFLTRKR